MAAGDDYSSETEQDEPVASGQALVVAFAALAAVGVGLALMQLRERRLSKPELARLKFYRYLRERGRLES